MALMSEITALDANSVETSKERRIPKLVGAALLSALLPGGDTGGALLASGWRKSSCELRGPGRGLLVGPEHSGILNLATFPPL